MNTKENLLACMKYSQASLICEEVQEIYVYYVKIYSIPMLPVILSILSVSLSALELRHH